MPELPLDHVQGDALAGHLNGMGVAELMRREPSPHASLSRQPLEAPANRSVPELATIDANSVTDPSANCWPDSMAK